MMMVMMMVNMYKIDTHHKNTKKDGNDSGNDKGNGDSNSNNIDNT